MPCSTGPTATAASRKSKQVYIQGHLLFENKGSEMVLMRIAEARLRERYRRRTEQISWMEIDPDKLTPEQLDCIANHLIKRALDDNPKAAVRDRSEMILMWITEAHIGGKLRMLARSPHIPTHGSREAIDAALPY